VSQFLNEAESVSRLLEIFKNVSLEQYDTYFTFDSAYRNRLYRILVAVKDELTSSGPQARRSLTRLLKDDNPQVRLQAAQFVYPVAPEEARKTLEELKASRVPDQSLAAGMTLRRLEEAPDCLDH
jgi:hypothetical protein